MTESDERTYTESEVRQALSAARDEAHNHNEEYSAGMRHSCSIIEGELADVR